MFEDALVVPGRSSTIEECVIQTLHELEDPLIFKH